MWGRCRALHWRLQPRRRSRFFTDFDPVLVPADRSTVTLGDFWMCVEVVCWWPQSLGLTNRNELKGLTTHSIYG